MKNVVLLGGAFNPVTIGHITTAQSVMDAYSKLDELWFLPCYKSVWGKQMVSGWDRVNMLHLAVRHSEDSRLHTCNFEVRNKLTGHTFEILKKLFDRYPDSHYMFYFLIGMDHANIIHTWGHGEELIKTLKFIVVTRAGVERDPKVTWYTEKPHVFIDLGPMVKCEVSSTMARNAIKEEGKTDLVIPEVMEYIRKRGFYL